MIWECAECGNQVVDSNRPGGCRSCGEVRFYVPGSPGARQRAESRSALLMRTRFARFSGREERA